jgi:hypothetical protein
MCTWSFTKLQRVSPNFIMFENLFFGSCQNVFKFVLFQCPIHLDQKYTI